MQKNVLVDASIHDVALNKLKPYRDNPRVGNIDAIASSLEINGQYRPIVVRKETGEILAGNHTWKAANKLGWKTIKVSYVENISDDDAKKIVLADNRHSDLATYDEALLAELIESLNGDIGGTGFEYEKDSDLERELENANSEVPDFEPVGDGSNPRLDERVVHNCPSCGAGFVMVNGKPQDAN